MPTVISGKIRPQDDSNTSSAFSNQRTTKHPGFSTASELPRRTPSSTLAHTTLSGEKNEIRMAILRKISLRGVRALGVLFASLTALYFAGKWKEGCCTTLKKQTSMTQPSASERYIQEMADGGWPVENADLISIQQDKNKS